MSNELKRFYTTEQDGVIYDECGPYYDADLVEKVLAEKDKEILDLIEKVQKERSAKVDYKISANDLSNGLEKAYKKIRRLYRAFYKACANWAHVELSVGLQHNRRTRDGEGLEGCKMATYTLINNLL